MGRMEAHPRSARVHRSRTRRAARGYPHARTRADRNADPCACANRNADARTRADGDANACACARRDGVRSLDPALHRPLLLSGESGQSAPLRRELEARADRLRRHARREPDAAHRRRGADERTAMGRMEAHPRRARMYRKRSRRAGSAGAAHGDAYASTRAHCDAYPDAHSYAHPRADRNAYPHANRDTYACTRADRDANADRASAARRGPARRGAACAGAGPHAYPHTRTCTHRDATPAPAPKSVPEISIVGGGAITEGGDATFTVTVNPAPTGNIAVTFVAIATQTDASPPATARSWSRSGRRAATPSPCPR